MVDDSYNNSRYARLIPLSNVGKEGLKRIRKARVVVVGCGGLGSVTAVQLTSLGVGFLRIVDGDVVEISNLQRQTLYREEDIGKPKADVAEAFLKKLNPDIQIEKVGEYLSEENIEKITSEVDFIIDAVDNFKTRYLLNRIAIEKDIPFIFGSVSAYSGNVMTIQRGSVCLECLFGQDFDEILTDTTCTGVHPAIINIIGSIQISEATKIMLGETPSLLNKLQFCDIRTMDFEALSLKPNHSCFCRKYVKK
ncbi:adenylyltransferase [Candidatus Heimdallarchaeota archaeon]|nr:MAG: adenylyltransferase [Candidatus Gerdarchaeota archaeon]RLI72053.1 MAG: adenylyltransferase [Candidatus Heimdallarchaeota archaeon]